MKRIKWVYLSAEVNHGTEEEPNIQQIFVPKDFHYSKEAEEAAKREAGDDYEIYDDGIPEPEPTPSVEERVDSLEESSTEMQQAIDVLLLGAV